MNRQIEQRKAAEEKVVAELQAVGKWTGATHVAMRLGWPWRIVSRALQRLAANGDVEAMASEWRSKRSRMRQTTLYRARRSAAIGLMPVWLEPPVPTLTVVRVVVHRIADDDEGAG